MPSALRLREDYSAEALRALARRSKDANQSRRLLSLAAVRDGMDRGSAAKIGGMDRQTLRDWVHRFNGRVWRASSTIRRRVPSHVFRRSNWLSSRRSSRRVRIVRRTGSALASDRPQTRHRREVRRRLSSALCRKAPQETRLLPHQCAATSSSSGRADRRGFQKRMARPVCKGICRDRPLFSRLNVSPEF